MGFSEQPASKEWAVLKFKGEKLAEVCFKPDGDLLALLFRIPRNSFQIPGLVRGLTMEKLLKAVAIAPEEIESWRHGDVSHPGLNGSNPELKDPVPEPPQDVPHLDIYVRLQGPREPVVANDSTEPDAASVKWQALEARWKTLLGIEASVDTLRISMEGVLAEMESSLTRALTTEEKVHALSADVTQWNKAKSRVRFALPKPREFIHRATWAKGAPERKRLDEIFKNATSGDVPTPEMDKVEEELEIVRKDRQVLSALGTALYQECKSIVADVHAALRRLQSNSSARAAQKKAAAGAKRKKG